MSMHVVVSVSGCFCFLLGASLLASKPAWRQSGQRLKRERQSGRAREHVCITDLREA